MSNFEKFKKVPSQQRIEPNVIASIQKRYSTPDRQLTSKYIERELLKYLSNLALTPELLTNKKILDIGSGDHFFDDYCAVQYNAEVVALDDYAENLGVNHAQGVVGDARALPFPDGTFDVVISHASMPHMLVGFDMSEVEVQTKTASDLFRMFSEVIRVLKPGGQARMATYSEHRIIARLEARGSVQKTSLTRDQINRTVFIKRALEQFREATGKVCEFKDTTDGGLIILRK